jgi:hypothetical protein
MKKRKTLNVEDIKAIIDIINRQDIINLERSKNLKKQDPQGWCVFMNTVACRNIREGLLKYLETVMDEEVIPYSDFMEYSDFGRLNYIKEHKND